VRLACRVESRGGPNVGACARQGSFFASQRRKIAPLIAQATSRQPERRVFKVWMVRLEHLLAMAARPKA